MFKLFKKRAFSDYINDTFSFLKQEWKTYTKNYLTICGVFILILIFCMYFLSEIFFEATKASNTGDSLDTFFEDNFALGLSLGAIAMIVTIIFSLISYAYPILYLKTMVDYPDNYKDANHIKSLLKQNIGRLIVFFLGITFIVLPLFGIVFFISVLLVFLLIGIPLLIVLIPAFFAFTSLAFYEYLTRRTPFFASLGIAFNMIKSNLGQIIGTTIIFYIIGQVISSIPTVFIQIYIVGFDLTSSNDVSLSPTYKILLIIILLFAFLIGIIVNNIMLINQGLIYYSCREQKENHTTHNEIDSIGSHADE
ncbi:hypothetical protein [Myroides injenensis]|uniref:hypothetical protein n=1 Tax=Myroides injenensis TaxID=1183151 RepID=UPI00028A1AB8|nr:hypothetical protein [Myroides injenensis]